MSDTYFLAPALGDDGLRGEINAAFPHRDKTSDGWIGDASHAARPSDHNPCWSCTGREHGIVRATDTDIDDGDPGRDLRVQLLNATIGDPRVWYVISNGIIYSRTYGWAARKYTGTNGHFHHVHVSLLPGAGCFDTGPWFEAPFKVVAKPVSLSALRRQFLAAFHDDPVTVSNDVGRVQRVLVRHYGADLEVDGLAGRATLRAWKRWEKGHDGKGELKIPDAKSLPAFARGHFRVAA